MSNKVFFLGAGFSKAINKSYPLLSELTQQVFDRLEKESVRTHLDEIPYQVKQNIESLLTYLTTDFPWKTDTTKYENKALYSAIVQILSNIFLEYARKEQSCVYTHYDLGENLATKISSHLEDYNFITLNYDVLLEQTLLRIIREKTYCESLSHQDFYPYPMTSIYARNGATILWGDPEDGFRFPKILKLHGSANWFWAGVTPSDILYYCDWHKEETVNITKGLIPYIIPPVLDKNAFYNHIAIRSLWQQAEQLLKQADEIYIIGFSFPQTDLAIRYLFQSAIRKKIPYIYVINIASKQKLSQSYSKVFGNIKLDYTYTGTECALEKFVKEHLSR